MAWRFSHLLTFPPAPLPFSEHRSKDFFRVHALGNLPLCRERLQPISRSRRDVSSGLSPTYLMPMTAGAVNSFTASRLHARSSQRELPFTALVDPLRDHPVIVL